LSTSYQLVEIGFQVLSVLDHARPHHVVRDAFDVVQRVELNVRHAVLHQGIDFLLQHVDELVDELALRVVKLVRLTDAPEL